MGVPIKRYGISMYWALPMTGLCHVLAKAASCRSQIAQTLYHNVHSGHIAHDLTLGPHAYMDSSSQKANLLPKGI